MLVLEVFYIIKEWDAALFFASAHVFRKPRGAVLNRVFWPIETLTPA